MLRLLTVFWILSSLFAGSLAAAYMPLKAKNGRMAEFQVEAIEADGLRVVRKGGYKEILLGWELLDLEWLKANQPDLWQKKVEIEKAQRLAFRDYYFGAHRAEISHQIRKRDGLRIDSGVFGDTAPNVVWVCFDVDALREFYRFRFDEDDRLEELQVHRNFDSSNESEAAMKEEWEGAVDLVSSYRSELIQHESYNRLSDWRRVLRKLRSAAGKERITHRWKDAKREFEVALVWQEIEIGAASGTASGGKITFFGKEMMLQGSPMLDPNWVIFRAVSK